MGPGAAVTQCTNYINGSPVTESCSGDCCLDGGSYAITLDKEDVCAAVCDSEIPTRLDIAKFMITLFIPTAFYLQCMVL